MRAENEQSRQCQRQPKSQKIKCQAPFCVHLHTVHSCTVSTGACPAGVDAFLLHDHLQGTHAEQVCRPRQALRCCCKEREASRTCRSVASCTLINCAKYALKFRSTPELPTMWGMMRFVPTSLHSTVFCQTSLGFAHCLRTVSGAHMSAQPPAMSEGTAKIQEH